MAEVSAFVHTLIVHFGLVGLFIAMAIGNIGIPVGTELLMPTAGALAAAGHLPGVGPIPAWAVAAFVGTLGELAGGSVLFAIGWFGGMPFVHRYGKYVGFREHHLERVHAFYERYGSATVFWSRFIPFVRGVGALPPGISRMPRRYFLTYTALGSAIFCFTLSFLGNLAGRNLDAIAATIHEFSIAILVATLLGAVAVIAWLRVVRARGRAATVAKSVVSGRNQP